MAIPIKIPVTLLVTDFVLCNESAPPFPKYPIAGYDENRINCNIGTLYGLYFVYHLSYFKSIRKWIFMVMIVLY